METKGCSVFDPPEYGQLTAGLQLARCMTRGKTVPPEITENFTTKLQEDLVISDARSCSCCGVQFADTASQRAHFKLDWHRYNLKRQLVSLPVVGEEAFDNIADKDEVESISGSESETEDNEETTDKFSKGDDNAIDSLAAIRHARVFFKNNVGQIISLYRCLLVSHKDSFDTDLDLASLALQVGGNDTWAIIMLGGGHFAAAVYHATDPVVHKTFHCYTVRAKQGGSQSSRDSRGGNHPKSAGASLRRYNEQALVQHVQDLISAWADHLKACSLIFYRAVGPHNRSVLFGGKNPPLMKTDQRLRTIPFPTRRATYSEVQRVHGILSKVEVHGMEDDFPDSFPPSPQRKFQAAKEVTDASSLGEPSSELLDGDTSKRPKSRGKHKPDRAKSRPSPQRLLPAATSRTSSESENVSGSEMSLTCEVVEINLNRAQKEYEDSIQSEMSKPKSGKKKSKPVNMLPPSHNEDKRTKEEKQRDEQIKQLEAERKRKIEEKRAQKVAAAAKRKQLEEEEAANNPSIVFRKRLEAAILSGNVAELNTCLSKESLDQLPGELPGGLTAFLNYPLSEGNTALHIASKAGHKDMISVLMLAGANPSVWNKKSQPPFVVATCSDVRSAFRDFMQENPDLFDYSGSKIPTPLTDEKEKEKAEKKAAIKKAKREKEKDKKIQQAQERAEREERQKFLALSDREKRALAAERRMLAAQQRGIPDEKPVVLARCFLCAVDITGKVPFEYEQFKFCSMDCLKAHRHKKLQTV